jgi:hypothetical protein
LLKSFVGYGGEMHAVFGHDVSNNVAAVHPPAHGPAHGLQHVAESACVVQW